MFERTKSRDEEHVDERAYKFFRWGYTGVSNSGYSWDSLSQGLRPTTCVVDDRDHYCIYCGRAALPIQGSSNGGGYSGTFDKQYYDKGKCCVCKDAMDELEMLDQMEKIKDQFEKALYECQVAMPKRNPEVINALIDRQAARKKKDLEFWTKRGDVSTQTVFSSGFKLVGPSSKRED